LDGSPAESPEPIEAYWMTSSAARLVLASASPRRRQLLSVLGIPFEAIELDLDETARPDEAPGDLACRLAVAKARAGAVRCPAALVLGADTVVELAGESLGKPGSAPDAVDMLDRLRGRAHRVVTAVALAHADEPGAEIEVASRVATAEVWMRDYTEHEIRAYVASGDPYDKAGGYAIQHPTFRPVSRIVGCFLTVVGLPLPEVCELLRSAGVFGPRVDANALEAACPGCIDSSVLLRHLSRPP